MQYKLCSVTVIAEVLTQLLFQEITEGGFDGK